MSMSAASHDTEAQTARIRGLLAALPTWDGLSPGNLSGYQKHASRWFDGVSQALADVDQTVRNELEPELRAAGHQLIASAPIPEGPGWLYSGPLGPGHDFAQNAQGWKVDANNLIKGMYASGANIKAINSTPPAAILNTQAYAEFVAAIHGEAAGAMHLRGSRSNEYSYAAGGTWATASNEYAKSLSGDVLTLTAYALPERVFGTTELPAVWKALQQDNSPINSIDGIPRDRLLEIGRTAQANCPPGSDQATLDSAARDALFPMIQESSRGTQGKLVEQMTLRPYDPARPKALPAELTGSLPPSMQQTLLPGELGRSTKAIAMETKVDLADVTTGVVSSAMAVHRAKQAFLRGKSQPTPPESGAASAADSSGSATPGTPTALPSSPDSSAGMAPSRHASRLRTTVKDSASTAPDVEDPPVTSAPSPAATAQANLTEAVATPRSEASADAGSSMVTPAQSPQATGSSESSKTLVQDPRQVSASVEAADSVQAASTEPKPPLPPVTTRGGRPLAPGTRFGAAMESSGLPPARVEAAGSVQAAPSEPRPLPPVTTRGGQPLALDTRFGAAMESPGLRPAQSASPEKGKGTAFLDSPSASSDLSGASTRPFGLGSSRNSLSSPSAQSPTGSPAFPPISNRPLSAISPPPPSPTRTLDAAALEKPAVKPQPPSTPPPPPPGGHLPSLNRGGLASG